MVPVSFFTPVYFSNDLKNSSPLFEWAENYFDLGGETAVVLSLNKEWKDIRAFRVPSKESFFRIALKVASFATVIIPLVALVLKRVFRSLASFQWDNGSVRKIIKAFRDRCEEMSRDSSEMLGPIDKTRFETKIRRASSVSVGGRGVKIADDIVIKENPSLWRAKRAGELSLRLKNLDCSRIYVPHWVKRTYNGKDYIIEEKVKSQIVLCTEFFSQYVSSVVLLQRNVEAFSSAAEEMAKLFLTSDCEDLIGNLSHDVLTKLAPKAPVARYDNILLHLDKDGEGKAALVDFEYFRVKGSKLLPKVLARCKLVISFFPYHYEKILIIFKETFPELAGYTHELKEHCEEVKRRNKMLTGNLVEAGKVVLSPADFEDDRLKKIINVCLKVGKKEKVGGETWLEEILQKIRIFRKDSSFYTTLISALNDTGVEDPKDFVDKTLRMLVHEGHITYYDPAYDELSVAIIL